ncbi:hypothetical protein M9Y10_013368 [Tritrichomonas musculus]|uniref:Uncharacterized protein n=1 Tax=Tritrichomonas musculus TaxID=1915356 RepID=A0ABR2I7T3_9EUKA
MEKHSISASFSFSSQARKKNLYFLAKRIITRSKSHIFYSNSHDFVYLISKCLKSTPSLTCKIHFFQVDKKNKIILKRSRSCDSMKNYSNFKSSSNISQINNTNLQIKSNNDHSFFFHNDKSYFLLPKSQSIFDLNSFLNNYHNFYLIDGHIQPYLKIFSKVNYNQHVNTHNLYNLSSSTIDLTDFFKRDDRVNEREAEYIEIQRRKKKFTYFNRQKDKKLNKKSHSKKTDQSKSSTPQKAKPRFQLYFPKDSSPLTKKTFSRPQPPRLSPAFVLNDKYNIRTRVFKENNIRNFYQELAIAEEDDKHFIFNPKVEFQKRKRSRSAETQISLSFTFLKKKRSKSAQNSPKRFVASNTSTPKSKHAFNPYLSKYSSPPNRNKKANKNQPPKPSSASVLNEKYNIRSRLFKEMHVHEFYKNYAQAEEDVKLQRTLKQVQMSNRSKRIVEQYMQRTKGIDSKTSQIQSENESQTEREKDNSSQLKAENEIEKSSSTENLKKSDKGSIQSESEKVEISNSIENLKEDSENSASISAHKKEDKRKIGIREINKAKDLFKEEEEVFEMKKFAHKVPGFVSEVTNFLKQYDIRIKEDILTPTSKAKTKPKKKKSHS